MSKIRIYENLYIMNILNLMKVISSTQAKRTDLQIIGTDRDCWNAESQYIPRVLTNSVRYASKGNC
ncbi:TPA: hypothetical protein KSL57_001676 [Clostridioides difficile]|nr:hypothetical protein [Clostridioides difficile]